MCSSPGIGRRRRGRGFSYFWQDDGAPVDDEVVRERVRDLVIPPAWTDVWICPCANGHIQAVGRDDAGRRQYLYHVIWRSSRDATKHEHVLDVARALPGAREIVRDGLSGGGLGRRRVLAAAVRLLDLGFFRTGGEQYADENDSYGLATVLREHVGVERGGVVVFEYPAKSGRDRTQTVADPDIVNDHLKDVFGFDVTAKDFRTWHATVLAAVGLAVSTSADSPTARKRAVARVIGEVAEYLGNTPAVARKSYVDPRVVDRFLDGETIEAALPALGDDTEHGHLATEGTVEDAVIALLTED